VQSGATDSAKKVAELFPWAPGSSRLCYTVSNHTSCVGIRNAAAKQGVEISYVDHDLTGLRLPRKSELPQCQHDLPFTGPPTVIAGEGRDEATPAKHGENLFVLSAECNFSGVKTDLRVVDALQHGTSASARPHDVRRWIPQWLHCCM
jgi:selenocysteine lyase/cysteine desulfurase